MLERHEQLEHSVALERQQTEAQVRLVLEQQNLRFQQKELAQERKIFETRLEQQRMIQARLQQHWQEQQEQP
jgi:hypothetical protein